MDLVAEVSDEIIPFEVKYRSRSPTATDLKGLLEMARQKSLKRAYVVTKSIDDIGVLKGRDLPVNIMRIPAPMLCYWMGSDEIDSASDA